MTTMIVTYQFVVEVENPDDKHTSVPQAVAEYIASNKDALSDPIEIESTCRFCGRRITTDMSECWRLEDGSTYCPGGGDANQFCRPGEVEA